MFKQIATSKVNFQIMNQIKESIRNGELKLGDRLPSERNMAEQMGVSRATVREAIRSMELMGLVKCVQGEGNFIPDSLEDTFIEPLSLMFMLNRNKVHEIGELRRGLEIEAVRLAAENISDASIEKLMACVEAIDAADNEKKRVEADKEFHYEITKASGNTIIINILNSLSQVIEEQMAGVRENIVKKKKDVIIINDQHKKIVEALAERNPQKAIAAMTEHMENITKHLELPEE